jgi:hypothetical protein
MDAYNKVIELKSVDADYAAFKKESAMDLSIKMTEKLKI